MKRDLVLLAACVAALVATVRAPAQEGTTDRSEPRFTAGLHVQGFWYDNFFQVPAGQPQDEVTATAAAGRVAGRPWADRPFTLYGSAGLTRFSDDLGDSPSFGAGARWAGRPAAWDLHLELQQDRPVVDVGDALGEADVATLGGEYSHRLTDDWQVSALGELQRQDFSAADGRDNDFRMVGGAVRYRGWGYDFSPEIGAETGERDADDPGEDHDQTDVWVKLRSAPVRDLYLSLRYRLRDREYTVADPAAANFGREDDRSQWSLIADWTVVTPWTLTLYWAYEDADSTKPARVFTTQILAVGVRYDL